MKRGEFIAEIAGRADDASFKVAQKHEYARWTNLAVREIWRAWPWTFAVDRATVQTVDGESLVDLPSGVQRPKRVQNLTTLTYLIPENERTLQKRYPDPTSTGPPYYYCDGGTDHSNMSSEPVRRIRLYPPADGVYDIEVTHIRHPGQMAQDDHYSPLPVDFDEAVILWCLSRFYRKIEDLRQSAEHQQLFRDEVQDLVGEFSVWQVDRYPRLEFERDD